MFMRCCSLWQCLVIPAFDAVVEAPSLAARTPTLGHKSLLSWPGLACINLQNPADSSSTNARVSSHGDWLLCALCSQLQQHQSFAAKSAVWQVQHAIGSPK
jgi:hypothetical protein